jgi:hypothetical protein
MKKKIIESRYFTRRQFLYGLGSSLILPTMVSLMPRALATELTNGTGPQRLLTFYSMYGVHMHHFLPNVTEGMFRKEADIPFFRHLDLSQINGDISYVLDKSLDEYREYLNVYQGLDLFDMYGHASTQFCGGIGDGTEGVLSGRSIDVILENSPELLRSFSGAQSITRWATGGQYWWNQSNAYVSRPFKEDGTLAEGTENTIYPSTEYRDGNLFNNLFGKGVQEVNNPTQDLEIRRKKLLVDRVLGDYRTMKNHRRISAKDKGILDQFIDGIFQVESKLQINDKVCTVPDIPIQWAKDSGWGSNPLSWDTYWDNVAKMVAMAFSCDQTRAFTLFNPSQGDAHHGNAEQIQNGWNEDPSSTVSTDPQKNYIRDIIVNKFVKTLKNTADPLNEGNLLDNSIAIWCNENYSRGHWHASIPVITFGKLGGQFKTGKYLDYNQAPHLDNPALAGSRRGQPIKRFLNSVLRGLGVSQEEINRNGDGKGYASWPDQIMHAGNPVATIRDFYPEDHFHQDHSKPLPFLSNKFRT